MFTATKIESTIKPKNFISLNNGVWYYNYDISEYAVPASEYRMSSNQQEQELQETRYSYVQVRINGTPTVSKCTEAILKQYTDDQGTSLFDVVTLQGTNSQIDDICYNIKVDFGLEEPISEIERAKNNVIRKIDEYDTSSNVNSFVLNGVQVWLDKDTRVGLMNSIQIEKSSGKEQSVLWFNNICITVNCDAAIQMLSALELYALECYNKTAEHKVAVQSLSTVEAINNYDYTQGYPSKLQFTI